MSRKLAIPEATRRAVALRYGCEPGGSKEVRCHYCPKLGTITWDRLASGKPGSWVHFTLALDHVIPESAGGTSDPENIVLACKRCNSSKKDKHLHDWLTNPSRQAHDILSEGARETVSGKGREGNKEWKGVRRASLASWRLVSDARGRDAMMPLRAFVIWREGFEPQPILEVLDYQAPEPAYPNGRVLIVGRGECPLWADRAQVVLA